MRGLLLVGALFDERRARVQRADEVDADVRRAGPGRLLEEDQLLGRRRAAAAVLLRPVQARVAGVEQAALPVGVPLAPLGPRVARRLRRERRAAPRRATRAARRETIRRRPSSAAPRSGESTSADARRLDRFDERARRVGRVPEPRLEVEAVAVGVAQLRGSGPGRTAPATSGRRSHTTSAVDEVERDRAAGRRGRRVPPSTTMRWRHCSHSAKHIAAGNSSAAGRASRTRARPSRPSTASAQFAVSELGRYSPAGIAALALPCAISEIVDRLRGRPQDPL